MLSTKQFDHELLGSIDEVEWTSILEIVSQHRIAPLLHWQLKNYHFPLDLPDSVNSFFQKAFHQSTLRSLELQRELVLISRIFKEANIPCVFLKGAFLAFYSYPHAGLRPMRDLDVLVPKESIFFAYETLLNKGYKRGDDYPGELNILLRTSAHLPPILPPSGNFSIEIHARIHHPNQGQVAENVFTESALWERAIYRDVGGESLRFLSETDLLLHLIVHAVYQHQFNNGPLLVSDIAYLLHTAKIDWPLFWRTANAANWEKGCMLVFKVLEQYWGQQLVEWSCDSTSIAADLEEMSELAAFSMLGNYDQRGDVQLIVACIGQSSVRDIFKELSRKLFPSRSRMETYYGAVLSPPMLIAMHFKRLASLMCRRLPVLMLRLNKNEIWSETRHLVRLNRWLGSSSP